MLPQAPILYDGGAWELGQKAQILNRRPRAVGWFRRSAQELYVCELESSDCCLVGPKRGRAENGFSPMSTFVDHVKQLGDFEGQWYDYAELQRWQICSVEG